MASKLLPFENGMITSSPYEERLLPRAHGRVVRPGGGVVIAIALVSPFWMGTGWLLWRFHGLWQFHGCFR
jgi:hypothetical protein